MTGDLHIRYWTTSETIGSGGRRSEVGLMVEAGSPAAARRAARSELRNRYPGTTIRVLSAAPAPDRFQTSGPGT